MNRSLRRAANAYLREQNALYPLYLIAVPRESWPSDLPLSIVEVWRSKQYLLQVHTTPDAKITRLTVCRTAMSGDSWADQITWEDLQRLKRECGRGHLDAVEVYPREADVVNVANMRHIWVFDEPLSFVWRARP